MIYFYLDKPLLLKQYLFVYEMKSDNLSHKEKIEYFLNKKSNVILKCVSNCNPESIKIFTDYLINKLDLFNFFEKDE